MLQFHSFKDSTQFDGSLFYIFSFNCDRTAPITNFWPDFGQPHSPNDSQWDLFFNFWPKKNRNLVASLVYLLSVFSDGGLAKYHKVAEQLLNAPTRKSSGDVY